MPRKIYDQLQSEKRPTISRPRFTPEELLFLSKLCEAYTLLSTCSYNEVRDILTDTRINYRRLQERYNPLNVMKKYVDNLNKLNERYIEVKPLSQRTIKHSLLARCLGKRLKKLAEGRYIIPHNYAQGTDFELEPV